MEDVGKKGRVCVTGAGGYVASWLVKDLLSKGYMVHGTVRDPGNEKNSHLQKLDKARENLQLFKADLLDYNSVAAAVEGCEGVFHVASPVALSKVANPEVELIAPAVTGTLNVLKACSVAKVKRVVMVSSVAAVLWDPNWPKGRVMDENCWSDPEYCRKIQYFYAVSKILAEREALDYAKKHELDVVTLCPSVIIGRLLQSTVNATSSLFLNLFKGSESVENKTWYFVDVQDVAHALLLLYEKPEASGRYICASHRANNRDLVDILRRKYPNYDYPKEYIEPEVDLNRVTSEKLQMLGWRYRTLEETLIDIVTCFQESGILDKN